MVSRRRHTSLVHGRTLFAAIFVGCAGCARAAPTDGFPETLWVGYGEDWVAAPQAGGDPLPDVMFMTDPEDPRSLIVLAHALPPPTTPNGDVMLELRFDRAAGYVPKGTSVRIENGVWKAYTRVADDKLKAMYEAEYGEPFGKWWGGGDPK